MDFKRVGKRWFTGLSLDARSGRQVVTLDTLREYFHGQMSLAWDGSGVASPVITGDKAKLEGSQQAQQSTACVIAALARVWATTHVLWVSKV